MDVGHNITKLRMEKGIYQKELALYLKVSIGTISNYEKGRHYPDPNTLCKIAEFFGVTTDYLLGRTNFRYDPELLFRPYIDQYTVSDLVITCMKLSPKHRNALLEYAELLLLREEKDSSGK